MKTKSNLSPEERADIRSQRAANLEAKRAMIAHSIMYPELLKGLAFLGSMYCGSQEYWQDMVHFDNIKEES